MPPSDRVGAGGLVVIAAGVPWDGPAMSEKRLARALSSLVPVLYVDPPRSALSHLRRPELSPVSVGRVEVVGPGLTRITPRSLPGVSRPGLRVLAIASVRRAVRTALRQLDAPADVLIAASFDDVLGAVPARLRVLWGTDDWVAGAELMHLSRAWLERSEARQLRSADRVMAVSDALATRWRRQVERVDVLPNGCDAAFFASTLQASPAEDVRLVPPVAGFMGHISERIDLALLEAVVDGGRSLLMVGPVQPSFDTPRWRSLLARPGVQWVGPRRTEELPAYLAHVAVGLTPYADTAFNRSSFPLKTLEYLAAGLPVVSSDLPAARELPPGLVHLARGPQEFSRAVDDALRHHDARARDRRLHYAATQSWDARASQLIEMLEIPTAGTSPD